MPTPISGYHHHRRLPVTIKPESKTFQLLETTVADVHKAFADGELTARELVQMYLDRIEAYDNAGPAINSVITVSSTALAEADALDAKFRSTGPVGPLHGIPVLIKDQVDTVGMPTTMGSVIFKDYYPDRDAFVIEKLKAAGAIILGKVTLGEMGGGDTHGTLFGSTKNPYSLERTAGGSSGGSGAAAAANFATITVGQEGFASIRRPSAWNSCAGMRPSPGLVSRSGAYGGWPSRTGSLGPICRTVEDMARLLDVMVGYDPEDPGTAFAVGHTPLSYVDFLEADGLRGARIGVLRESMASNSEPDSEDFKNVTAVFERAMSELEAAGATLVDVTIPNLNELLAKRAGDGGGDSFMEWMNRSANPPFKSYDELLAHPEYQGIVTRRSAGRGNQRAAGTNAHYEYLLAKEELMANVLKVMADNELDAIVHKTVEHTPTLIKDGVNPPYVNMKGAPHINTFLVDAASVTVPAGFTVDDLPVGITFFGRVYSDASLIKFAYAYEQATKYRKPPASTPPLR